jgi:hypothetical protein
MLDWRVWEWDREGREKGRKEGGKELKSITTYLSVSMSVCLSYPSGNFHLDLDRNPSTSPRLIPPYIIRASGREKYMRCLETEKDRLLSSSVIR